MRGEAAARSRCARRVSASELSETCDAYATAALLNRGRGRSAGQVEVMERRGKVRCPRPAAVGASEVPRWAIALSRDLLTAKRSDGFTEVLDATRYSPRWRARVQGSST
jgi:hypothetical protein